MEGEVEDGEVSPLHLQKGHRWKIAKQLTRFNGYLYTGPSHQYCTSVLVIEENPLYSM